VRGVIGAEHVDDALLDPAPDPGPMLGRAHRRIHLRAGAETLIAFRRGQCQVMRRRLAGGDVLVVAQKLDLLLGGDMQHVNPLARLMGELDQPLGRHQRRDLIAPHRMRTWIALDAQSLAIVEAVLVFGMEGGAAPDHLENPAQAFVILDQ
jgi:hypothetical protein